MKGCLHPLQLHPRGRMEGFTEGPSAGEAPSSPMLPHPHGCMLGQGESCCPDEPLSPSACCQDRSALCRLSVIRLAGGSRLGLEGSRFYPLKGRRAAQSSAGGPSHGDGISPSILVRPGRQRCPNPLGGLDPTPFEVPPAPIFVWLPSVPRFPHAAQDEGLGPVPPGSRSRSQLLAIVGRFLALAWSRGRSPA